MTEQTYGGYTLQQLRDKWRFAPDEYKVVIDSERAEQGLDFCEVACAALPDLIAAVGVVEAQRMDCKREGISATTDTSLNRAVALARRPWNETKCRVCGWPIVSDDEPGCWQSNCSMRPPPAKRADEPADVCTSPAAWGALFVELKECPSIEYDGLGTYTAWVGGCVATDAKPGRALAMAFLKAKGVSL